MVGFEALKFVWISEQAEISTLGLQLSVCLAQSVPDAVMPFCPLHCGTDRGGHSSLSLLVLLEWLHPFILLAQRPCNASPN